MTLQVTEEERQAIDRLKQLGFPEEMVIQGTIEFLYQSNCTYRVP